MKCHLCNKNLDIVKDNISTYSKNKNIILSCPNDHCSIIKSNHSISEYKMMWDADSKAKERYWIYSWSADAQIIKYLRYNTGNALLNNNSFTGSTIVTISEYGRPHNESMLLSLDYFMPLNIKNDIIQINSVVSKINKLKAFI